jgi:hypothetical protein
MTLELHECAHDLKEIAERLTKDIRDLEALIGEAPQDIASRICDVPGCHGLDVSVSRGLEVLATDLQDEVEAQPEGFFEAAILRERERKCLTPRLVGLRLGTPPRVDAA